MKKQFTPHHYLADTVVIGGGLTGLVTAYQLRKQGHNVIVLEQNDDVGGVVRTCTEKGFTYEVGPNVVAFANKATENLMKDLEALVELSNQPFSRHKIWRAGKWHGLPSGVWCFIKSHLISNRDKWRLLGEWRISKGTNRYETVSSFVSRRLGKGFFDYIIDPFMSVIYAGDSDKLCMQYVFPTLYAWEQDKGSLTKGFLSHFRHNFKHRKRIFPITSFFSLRGGLGTLPKKLARRIGEENIYCNCTALHVSHVDDGYEVQGQRDGNSLLVKCKNLVSTVGAGEVPSLLPFLSSGEKEVFATFPYAPIIEVTLGFNKWQGINLDAFGGLVPYVEGKSILGILFMSSLFNGRCPEGGALFSVYLGGSRHEMVMDEDDDEILSDIRNHFIEMMGVREFNPDLVIIKRHKKAMAQYTHGHGIRLEMLDIIEERYPGLYIGGTGFGGVEVSDRIRQGQLLAEKIKK